MEDIFKPVVAVNKMHGLFKSVSISTSHQGCRQLMNEIFNMMPKPDSNFIEQFQTQGFEARVFELGLFAFLNECKLKVSQKHERPDFIVSNGNEEVCIEATVSSPPDDLKLQNLAKHFEDFDSRELIEKITNEVPIRFGSPLFSKLSKRYWDLTQCQGKALIIAIQACHEPMASQYPVTPLCNYVYGTTSFPDWTEDGTMIVRTKNIEEHRTGTKVIPSRFFGQKDTENISAVLFSNQMTVSKFVRMAFQLGYQQDMSILRKGMCSLPGVAEPIPYSYELGTDEAIQETWAQGLSLLINPGAEEPVTPFYFGNVTTHIFWEGELRSAVHDFHPLNSVTLIVGP